MARSVKPWEGKTDDEKIPDRVRQRVAARVNHCCQNCGMRVGYGGQIDHAIALILGGKNAESNLRLLCQNCHVAKSKADVAAKSRSAQTKKRVGPLVKGQSKWSKDYHAMKDRGYDPWKRSTPRPSD